MRIRSFANEIIDIGNVQLEIQVERTNRKRTISLQVKHNKLIIKTPRSVSKKTLDDLIKVTLVDQRANFRGRIQGMADLNVSDPFSYALYELVVDALLNQQAAR